MSTLVKFLLSPVYAGLYPHEWLYEAGCMPYDGDHYYVYFGPIRADLYVGWFTINRMVAMAYLFTAAMCIATITLGVITWEINPHAIYNIVSGLVFWFGISRWLYIKL